MPDMVAFPPIPPAPPTTVVVVAAKVADDIVSFLIIDMPVPADAVPTIVVEMATLDLLVAVSMTKLELYADMMDWIDETWDWIDET